MRIGKNGAEAACAAVVLAGGKSTRMGRDKALLPWGDSSLLAHVLGLVRPAFDPVYLSIGPGRPMPDLPGVTPVFDSVSGRGPLAGIVAALEVMPADWLFVLACDMPFAESAVWEALAGHIDDESDAVLVRTDRGLEPLFGYYHRRCLPTFRARLQQGPPPLHEIARDVPLREVEAARLGVESAAGAFTNLNTPEEFAAAWDRAAERARREG